MFVYFLRNLLVRDVFKEDLFCGDLQFEGISTKQEKWYYFVSI